MDERDNLDFRFWAGGAYKEPLFLILYRVFGIFVAHLTVLIIWMGFGMQEYILIVYLFLFLIGYAIAGCMLVNRSRGCLQFYGERMVIIMGWKSKEVCPWDIGKIQYYTGKSVKNVPYADPSVGTYVNATYNSSYTLNFQIKNKWYSLYDVYDNVNDDIFPEKMELHQVYLKLLQFKQMSYDKITKEI